MRVATRRVPIRLLPVTVAAGAWGVFIWLIASHALTDGLCCGDDAAISLAAKSLAAGQGYSIPLNFFGESGHFPFHPGLSTGPTLVLPAAAMIMIFGPQIWVPSVTSASLSLGLLGFLCFLFSKMEASSVRRSAFVCALLVGLYFLTSNGVFFIQWYSLLGEIPATFLLVLAAWLVSHSDRDGVTGWRHALLGGVAAGFAIDSKLLALLGALAVGGVFAIRLFGRERGYAFRDGVTYALGMLTPVAAFECARLWVLGFDGYIEWTHGLRDFFASQAPASLELQADALDRAHERFASLRKNAGFVWVIAFVPLLSPALWLLAERAFLPLIRCSAISWVAGITYMVWWLFYSNGWARYGLIGFGLLVVAAIFALSAQKKKAYLAGLIVLLMCLAPWGGLSQLTAPLRYALDNEFVENERVTALREVARYLNNGSGRDAVVAGSWWAALVPVEYVSEGSRRTVAFDKMYTARKDLPGTLLLKAPKWDAIAGAEKNPKFQSFEKLCARQVLLAPPYELYSCGRISAP